ncbi:YfjI family protein [Saccharopolyspora sp. NPDC050642]|uniref:YfjI family protein n=1 Tax=Saccharopolyspora sp. NPDC050642 TaxID=3157099 RepID=UPI0033CD7F97
MTAHLTVVLNEHPEPRTPQTSPWEEPTPLGMNRELPAFPTDALPDWMAEMVTAVSGFTQTPPDLAACVGLSGVSTAIGGRATIRIRQGYTEPSNLFLVCALPPGSRKSEVFRVMTDPVVAVEEALIEQARPRIVEANLARRIAQREAEDAEQKADSGDPDSVGIATEAAMRAEKIEVPVEPCLIVDDTTPEKAASMLIEQGGRLAVLAPEGGIISIIAGRYSGTPNYDVFLRGHAGEKLNVTRQNRDKQKVDKAHLTLGLVVQPVVLRNLAGIQDAKDKGLLGRFLYSLPTSTLGFREVRNAPPIPSETATAYDTRLRLLVHHYAGLKRPVDFVFDHDANEAMFDVQEEIEPHLRRDGAYGHMTDWAGKYAGATARLAGALHALQHLDRAGERKVTGETFAQARRIGEYFLAHALATFDFVGTDPDLDDARTVLEWIETTQPVSFTERAVLNAHRRSLRTAERVKTAVHLLEEHGHVLRTDPPQRPGPGRKPGPTYWPHPNYRAPQDRP